MSRATEALLFALAYGCGYAKLPPMEQSYLIEAGQAFGDGAHPSTALALWLLGGMEASFRPRNALDIGCGSGILSLGATLRWGIPTVATDIAPEAVAQTRANAEANGVASLITVLRADGTKHPEVASHAPYDLLMSNILTDLHIRNARDFVALLAPGGRMLLSGILAWRAQELLGYYDALGMEPLAQETSGDWAAFVLSFKETA